VISGRFKVLGLFALLGFLSGIAVNTIYDKVFPNLLMIYPELIQAEWILSGLAGAILTTTMIVLWSFLNRTSAAYFHLISIFSSILGLTFSMKNFPLPGLTLSALSVFSALVTIFRGE
jgi:hypothetical protein